MLRASCLCGKVTWKLEEPLEMMSHCHCSRCRKTHGTPFATYVAGPAATYELKGGDEVARWESSPGFARCFCRTCGSVVPGDASEDRIFVPAGNFIDDPGARPLAHIFVGSKASYYDIADELPQFEAYPPAVKGPIVADLSAPDPAGPLRGSCLCQSVAFVVEGQPLRAFNCHCGRCRRGRSAAHAANMFLAADGLRFTRGEEQVVSYKVPDAERFTQTFCRTCGSLMPRVSVERGMAIVPMGALDDDPGIRPEAHIFVASKAPWFEIADQLPQFPEYPS